MDSGAKFRTVGQRPVECNSAPSRRASHLGAIVGAVAIPVKPKALHATFDSTLTAADFSTGGQLPCYFEEYQLGAYRTFTALCAHISARANRLQAIVERPSLLLHGSVGFNPPNTPRLPPTHQTQARRYGSIATATSSRRARRFVVWKPSGDGLVKHGRVVDVIQAWLQQQTPEAKAAGDLCDLRRFLVVRTSIRPSDSKVWRCNHREVWRYRPERRRHPGAHHMTGLGFSVAASAAAAGSQRDS